MPVDLVISHESLRKAAVRWLTGSKKCSVVLSEMVSAAAETPDAIGWKFGASHLVECKVSRSDFFANANKGFIRAGCGMGRFRYFLCPYGLITVDDLTKTDYGLLWLTDTGRVRVMREPTPRESAEQNEIVMLVSALRRVRTREFLTINVLPEDALV